MIKVDYFLFNFRTPIMIAFIVSLVWVASIFGFVIDLDLNLAMFIAACVIIRFVVFFCVRNAVVQHLADYDDIEIMAELSSLGIYDASYLFELKRAIED